MDEAEQQRPIDAGNSIDLKWLRSFAVVADEGSFTTAAARLHVSQPGLAHQIQALERQLGGRCSSACPAGCG